MSRGAAPFVFPTTFLLDAPSRNIAINVEFAVPGSRLDNCRPTDRQLEVIAKFYNMAGVDLSRDQAHSLLSVLFYSAALSRELVGTHSWRRDIFSRMIAQKVLANADWLGHATEHSGSAFVRNVDYSDFKPERWKTFPAISHWFRNTLLPQLAQTGLTFEELTSPMVDSFDDS